MTTTKPDVDLAGIRKIVEAPFDHEQYVSNNLWLVEQVPALLDLVDAQRAEIERLNATVERMATDDYKAAAEKYARIPIVELNNAYDEEKQRRRTAEAELSRLTASASSGRNAGEVAAEIVTGLRGASKSWQFNADWLCNAITAALEARDIAHAGREERMRKALVAIPLTTQSCHGRGGWLVCTGCGERANMLNDIPHKHDCYVPLVRAALADQPASQETDHAD